ncbi:MAG: hypothetical protein ACYCOU_12145 [Sulfobacillus sp.]
MTMIVGMANDSTVILAADSQDSGRIDSLNTGVNSAQKLFCLSATIAVAIAGSAQLNDGQLISKHLKKISSILSQNINPSQSNRECAEAIRNYLCPYTDGGHELQLIIGFAEPVALFCVRLPTGTIKEIPDRQGYRFAMAGQSFSLWPNSNQ